MFETIEDHAKKLYPQLAKRPTSWLLLIASILILVLSIYRLMRL